MQLALDPKLSHLSFGPNCKALRTRIKNVLGALALANYALEQVITYHLNPRSLKSVHGYDL